jgi:hypothetical protein
MFDGNVTVVAKDPLVELGHDVDTVADEGGLVDQVPDVLEVAIASEPALVDMRLAQRDQALGGCRGPRHQRALGEWTLSPGARCLRCRRTHLANASRPRLHPN